MDVGRIFTSKECPNCGKVIVRASFTGYTYKHNGKVYCGWNCYRKATAEEREKIKEKTQKKR